MTKVSGYIRVSGIGQVDGSSLDVQKAQIEAYCILKGFQLVNIYCDAAVSGGMLISGRPEGSKLMASIDNGEISGMVLVKLDRGFRNTIDCLNTVDQLDKLHVSLHIIDLGGSSVDSQSPSGRFMLTVLAAAAEMERGQIKVRCNSGREKARIDGKKLGTVRYGFSADENGILLECPAELEVLAEVKNLRSLGFTLRDIADSLNSKGYTNRKGIQWNHGSIANLLKAA